MNTHGKFVVGKLFIKYAFNKKNRDNSAYFYFKKALWTLFGDGYSLYCNSVTITVPITSSFIEIDTALAQEFSKHPALKGMRFQLQMCEDMLIVQ